MSRPTVLSASRCCRARGASLLLALAAIAALAAPAAWSQHVADAAASAPALSPALPEMATPRRGIALPGGGPTAIAPVVADPQRAARQMVAAAHPLAAEAGLAMLRAGGSAVDAAIAAQAVLGLVEPQSSGIGGGAFLLHFDGQRVSAWDGRETAPADADERMFLGANGQPLPFAERVFGGRSVGVPGALRMLEAAHRQHGRLPWARLFERAIALAEQGFPLGERLHAQLAADPLLRRDAAARAFYYRDDGSPHPVGHPLRNPALAELMRRIAAQGADVLHRGPVAQDLVRRVREHAVPGRLSEGDLAGYRPVQRDAICSDWLQRWRVCGFPPPSSGHLAVMQILGLLERSAPVATPLRQGIPGPDWLHAYTEAARLAYADRDRYVADPAFAAAPGGRWTTLLDDAYLRRRAALIGPRSLGRAEAGDPAPAASTSWAPMPAQPEVGTSHVSVVDAQGRAVSLTTTIEAQFGARILADGGTGLAGGYLLNNQLTDFSALPADAQGRPVANRVQGGKRPRSSMAPTLVFDRSGAQPGQPGRLEMTLGSPGGAAIIHFVAKTLTATLQWQLDPQAAIELPNAGSFNGPTMLERGRFPAATQQALRERGHAVQESELPSGLQAIRRAPDGPGWLGGADPRREGVALGD